MGLDAVQDRQADVQHPISGKQSRRHVSQRPNFVMAGAVAREAEQRVCASEKSNDVPGVCVCVIVCGWVCVSVCVHSTCVPACAYMAAKVLPVLSLCMLTITSVCNQHSDWIHKLPI